MILNLTRSQDAASCACDLTLETRQLKGFPMAWEMKGQNDIINDTHRIQEWDISCLFH